jgi:hypothetical protein
MKAGNRARRVRVRDRDVERDGERMKDEMGDGEKKVGETRVPGRWQAMGGRVCG